MARSGRKPGNPRPMHNMEDKVFNNLIRRYTLKRDWNMVQALFRDYGKVLEDREGLTA